MNAKLVSADVSEASHEEGRRMFDEVSSSLLGISGREFIARWNAGEYDGDDRLAVMEVAMLLPFAR